MALSHYIPGSLGVKNASPPPPGVWWENYHQFYNAKKVKDSDRSTVHGLGFDLNVYGNISHVAWITEKKMIGGNYGVDIFVPFVYTDIKTKATGVDEDTFGLGDIFIDPIVLTWYGKRVEGFFAAGAYIPTGKHHKASSPGRGYWTFMEQLGGTYYFDEAKTWTASLRGRLLQSTEDPDTNITPGRELILEYGVGKDFLISNNVKMTIGAGGYSYWQTSDDDGPDALNSRFSGHALGPEIQFTFFKPFLNVALRYIPEYQVKNATEGRSLSLVFIGGF
ncbi:MAG: transporter [Desulfopila sp.]